MSGHRLLVFLELKLQKGISFSRQHLNELVRRGVFPKAVKTPGGGHTNFWLEAEVDAYIERMIEARDTAPPDEAVAKRVAKMMAGRAAAKKKRSAAGTVTIARRKPRQPAAPAAGDPR